MAITYTNHVANAGQTPFVIAFPYIDATHVKVKINGVASTSFTIVGENVVLNSGATAGDIVRVYRQTPGRAEDAKLMLVDFQDGSVLSEAELDRACQQLLYLAQEADETGASSLAIDWDDNYTAAGRRIKDLSASVVGDEDATTKNYVDGQALYGGAISVPQTWLMTGANFAGVGGTGDCTVTLSSPTPLSDNDDLYDVYYRGAGQRPGTDYTVTESGGTYTFTLKMGSETLLAGDTVTIKNFGVSRSWIKQPLKGDTASDVALTVQRVSSGQSAKVQEWVTEDATPSVLASMDALGNLAVNGITGNLNILTGALQFGGVNSLRILQVVNSSEPTFSGAIDSSGLVALDGLTSNHYFGRSLTITPQSASSVILVHYSTQIQATRSSDSGIAFDANLVTGSTYDFSTAATLPAATGTTLVTNNVARSITPITRKYSSGGTTTQLRAHKTFIIPAADHSTSATRYDLVGQPRSSSTLTAHVMPRTVDGATFLMIEIG